jgi:[ribosomal protein S18]-alanine N-acetyltransferase
VSTAGPPGADRVDLRLAAPEDVPALAALEQEVFGADAWSEAAVAAELTAPGRQALVAVTGKEIMGYAVTWAVGDVADLQRLVVSSRARRRGIGTRLVDDLVARTAARGACRVLLEVSEANVAARACYRGLGFCELDRRPAYYHDGSDALVLALTLSPPPPEEDL